MVEQLAASQEGLSCVQLADLVNRQADHVAPSNRKVGTNFADKLRSLGRYSSVNAGH
jgi:hypothetical protein